jgi:hypothetical protein
LNSLRRNFSGIVLGMIDYAVLDIGGTIGVERQVADLRQTIDRLSLMLDEWPSLIKWVLMLATHQTN